MRQAAEGLGGDRSWGHLTGNWQPCIIPIMHASKPYFKIILITVILAGPTLLLLWLMPVQLHDARAGLAWLHVMLGIYGAVALTAAIARQSVHLSQTARSYMGLLSIGCGMPSLFGSIGALAALVLGACLVALLVDTKVAYWRL